MVVLGDDDRLMARGLCPVVGIVGVFSSGIREAEGNNGPLVFQEVGLDSGVEGILCRMDTCSDFNGLAISGEGGFYLTIP